MKTRKTPYKLSLTLESDNLIALKTKSGLIISVSNLLIPQNWRSDSWVTEIGLDWLDCLIFIVPFVIQKGSIKKTFVIQILHHTIKFPIVWAKALINEDFSFIVSISVIIIEIDTSQLMLPF